MMRFNMPKGTILCGIVLSMLFACTQVDAFAGPVGGEAVVVDVVGRVRAQFMEGSTRTMQRRSVALHRNTSVGQMSQISTGRNGQVHLLLSTGVLVSLGPNSSIKLEQLRHTSSGLPRREEDLIRQVHIRLHRGQMQVFGGPPKATLDIRVLTPDGVVAADGGVFSVAQLPGGDWAVFSESGEQRIVSDSGDAFKLGGGETARMARQEDGALHVAVDDSIADSRLRQVPGGRALYYDLGRLLGDTSSVLRQDEAMLGDAVPLQYDRAVLGTYLGGAGEEVVFVSTDVQIADVSPSVAPVRPSVEREVAVLPAVRVPSPPPEPAVRQEMIPRGEMIPRWDRDASWDWYDRQGVIKGGNYVPRYAVNSVEMWQADRFDPDIIREEFGWARDVGYTSMRVQLQAAVWQHDPDGFMERLETLLTIAQENDLQITPVLFDDLHLADSEPSVGEQPDPEPGQHNAHWLPSPGRARVVNEDRWPELEAFVHAVMGKYRDDPRILFWDVYNMAGAGEAPEESLPFMAASVRWAREMDPEQPIAVSVWSRLASAMSAHKLEMSDVVTFQSHAHPDEVEALLEYLARFDRPIICTGWLMRQRGNDFESILPLFSRYRVGWYNSGFANGRTQKWIQQDSYRSEESPDLWQHDILKEDGTPYRQEEIDAIRAFRFDAN